MLTGLTAGIGRAIAEGLARAGASCRHQRPWRGAGRGCAPAKCARFFRAPTSKALPPISRPKGRRRIYEASGRMPMFWSTIWGRRSRSLFRTHRRGLAGLVRDQRDERRQNDPPLSTGDDQARLGACSVHRQRVRARHPEGDDRLRHDEDRATGDLARRGRMGRRNGRHGQRRSARPDKL